MVRADSDIRSVARGSGANLVGAVVSVLANLGVILALTHILTRRDAGVFFATTSLFLLVETTAGLGSSTANVYLLPRFRQAGDHASAQRVVGFSARLVLGASLVGVVLLVALPRSYGQLIDGHGHRHGFDLLWILALLLPFSVLADVCQSSTRGYGQMRTTVMVEKIGRPLVQLVAVVLAALTHSVPLITLAWAVPFVPALVVSYRSLRRVRENPSVPATAPAAPIRRVYLGYALPRALTGVASLALQRLDIVLVAAITGPAAAAVYTAATRFLVVGQFVGQAVALPMQPRISGLLAQGSDRGAERLFRVTTAWLVLLTWPLYLSIAVYAGVFLDVFGHGYASGGTVVVTLALSLLLGTGVGQVDVMIAMGGRAWYSLANTVAALIVNVVLNLLLIPRYGIEGAAVAWAAAIAAGNLLALAEVLMVMRMHPFGRATCSSAVASVLCFALPGAGRLLHFSTAGQLVAYLDGAALYLLWLGRNRVALHLPELASVATTRYRRRRGGPGSA